jgi:hypothetical protein
MSEKQTTKAKDPFEEINKRLDAIEKKGNALFTLP